MSVNKDTKKEVSFLSTGDEKLDKKLIKEIYESGCTIVPTDNLRDKVESLNKALNDAIPFLALEPECGFYKDCMDRGLYKFKCDN